MLIALTGGIGSGKSALARELRLMGYDVYDTDSEAKRLLVSSHVLRQQMMDLLGEDIYEGDVYRTDRVASRVFAQPALLQAVNRLVHPLVVKDVVEWSRGRALCFVESAILYESGLAAVCDGVVLVTAPEEVRIERVLHRDHTTIDKVRARMHAQEQSLPHPLPDSVLVINNDGSQPLSALASSLLSHWQ